MQVREEIKEKWITIISFTYPHQAHIAKSYLDSNGIESYIQDEYAIQSNNFYSNAMGGVKIIINESDYDECVQLLKAGGYINDDKTKNILLKFSDIERVPTEGFTNKNICPFCKSDNISKNKKLNILIIPFYFILGFFLPLYRLSYKCFDCNKEWKYTAKNKNT